jgi:hypothetical protein
MGEMPTQFPIPPTSSRSVDRSSIRPLQETVAAFRACHERYKDCLEYRSLRTKSLVRETVDSYLLDFDIASKRAIGAHTDRYRLFQLHFLRGYSANQICEQLDIPRFTFAREIGEIEKTAGRAFIQRGLFPLNSYFGAESNLVSERRAA